MMKRLTSLACWLLLGLCPPLLGQCGGSAEPGTETGNPPRVEERKLYLVQSGPRVLLIGEAGAVSPGGAAVQLTNLRTGEQVEAAAGSDGALNLSIGGTPEDAYEIRVSSAGEVVNVRVPAPGAERGALDLLSCEGLENVLGQRVASGFAAADATCSRDTDCIYSGWGVSCYYQCGASFLSIAGQSAALAAIEAGTEPVCTELESRCVRQPASSCPPAVVGVPECRAGTCQGLDLNTLDCNTVSNRASERLGEILGRADRACITDDDCEVVNPQVSCFADCGNETNIAASAVATVTAGVAQVERDFCQNFESRACPPPLVPPCTPPETTTPVCNAGQCELLVTQ